MIEALCWGRGKWLITPDVELCGKGEGQEQGRSEAGWHMRGVFIAEQVWFGLV